MAHTTAVVQGSVRGSRPCRAHFPFHQAAADTWRGKSNANLQRAFNPLFCSPFIWPSIDDLVYNIVCIDSMQRTYLNCICTKYDNQTAY